MGLVRQFASVPAPQFLESDERAVPHLGRAVVLCRREADARHAKRPQAAPRICALALRSGTPGHHAEGGCGCEIQDLFSPVRRRLGDQPR